MPLIYNPRRPYFDEEPDGYQESDRCYLDNNNDLAVALLDRYGPRMNLPPTEPYCPPVGKDAPVWNKLLMSGLQRYVKIVEVVRCSNAFLSGGDRMALINELLDYEPSDPTVKQIEKRCTALANAMLQTNMVNARVRADYERGDR